MNVTGLDRRGWPVLLGFLALVSACAKPPEPPPPPAGPTPVSVAAALEREVFLSDEFPGQFEAVDSVEVRPRVSGYLQSIHFEPGSDVKRGQLLFVIDPRPFAAKLAQAEAALKNTEAQLSLARIEQKRQTLMLKDRATSQRELDAATAAVNSLEAAKLGNLAAIQSARLELEFTRITSPIDGRIGRDEVRIGNLVQGDNAGSALLTTIVSQDPIYVAFEADEQAYLNYLAGEAADTLSVAVGLANEADFPHQAKLAFVDNRLAAGSGTVRLRAVLANPARKFAPGNFARVKLQTTQHATRAVLVAERAIGTDQSKRFVLVVGQDNVANYREIHLGRQVGALRVISRGLKAGEIIVVNGLQRVRPGSPVAPQTVSMEEAPAPPAAG